MSSSSKESCEFVCFALLGQRFLPRLRMLLIAVAVLVWSARALGQTDTWKGGAGNWSDGTKWTAGVPTSTSNVFIDGGNPTASPVTLDIGGQANNLTIDSDDSLSFNNNTSLTINGSSISNAGSILLNSLGNLTFLFIANGAALTGAGTVTMSNNSQNAVDGNSGATLTNQSTIQGAGQIGPHFTLANQGTINANVNGAILQVSQESTGTDTNTATMEATNGGILQLATGGSSSINNTGGTIKAVGTNSQVQLSGQGTTINGGTLTTSGGGTIVVPAGTGVSLNGVTNSGTFSMLNNSTVNLGGTITNTGTIQLNSLGNLTVLFAPSSATLTGAGSVTMSNNSQNAVDGNSGVTLTNQSTIQGVGQIGPHFTLANQATIDANVNGAALLVSQQTSGTNTNTATMEATNGGILQLATGGSSSINNTGGTIKAVGTNSQVQLFGQGTTINGGILTASGGGSIVVPAGTGVTLNGVTNTGPFSILNNSTVNLGGTITNTSTIQLNSTGGLTVLFTPSTAILTGAGTVTMSKNSQNAVDGNGGATFTNQSTIQGVGQIGPHFTLANQGTIDANVSGAALQVSQETGAIDTNTATMEATNGGILQLATGGSNSINNTSGTIKAVGTNSQVQLFGQGTTIHGGTLTTSSGGTIVVPAGTGVTLDGVTNSGTFSILNNATVNLTSNLTNNGTINVNSTGGFTLLFLPTVNVTLAGKGRVVMNNSPFSAIDGTGGLLFANQSTIQGGGQIGPHFTFLNQGTVHVNPANTMNINGGFSNFAGTTLTGGTYFVSGILEFTNADIVTNSAKVTLSGNAAKIINQSMVNALANFMTNTSTGAFTVTGGQLFTTTLSSGFSNAGPLTVGKNSAFTVACNMNFSCPYTQTAGTTTVDGTLTDMFGVNINGGTLSGTGMVAASVVSKAMVTAGDTTTKAGVLTVSTYMQQSTGSLNVQIGGTIVGTQYSQLAVLNGASLNGTLNVKLINHFVPAVGDTFTILTGSAVSGTFTKVNLPTLTGAHFTITYNPTNVTLTVVSG